MTTYTLATTMPYLDGTCDYIIWRTVDGARPVNVYRTPNLTDALAIYALLRIGMDDATARALVEPNPPAP